MRLIPFVMLLSLSTTSCRYGSSSAEFPKLTEEFVYKTPPSLPSATAAGFFPALLSGSGGPSHCSPMACSTARRADLVKSWSLLERVGTIGLCHNGQHDEQKANFRLLGV